MLTLTVPKGQAYDQKNNRFYRLEKDTTIQLEHSLISLQKWEARWHKPFLKTKDKTFEETIDYIRCMCLTPNVKDDLFYCLNGDIINKISDYIEDPMTATRFRNIQGSYGPMRKKETVTAEIIYYWMINYNIPSEYKKWHLNQLLTLIQVLNIKNEDPKKRKKRGTKAILQDYKSINEENKKKFNTKG